MCKRLKSLKKVLFQRKPPIFKRKNGSSMRFKYRSAFIIVGLVAGLLSLVMIMTQYIGVLLQGEHSTHSALIHFNRYGELYYDGIALIGLLFVVSLALILYLKEFWKKEIANE